MSAKRPGGVRFRFLAGATELLGIARRTAESIPPDAAADATVRDSTLVAVVFAALSVEAFLNELPALEPLVSRGEAPLAPVEMDDRTKALLRVLDLAEDHNIQPVFKLVLAHELLGRPLDRGAAPFQDYLLLKQLRDAIVHAKPSDVTIHHAEGVEFKSSRDKMLRALQAKALLAADPANKGQSLLNWLGSPRLGRWAVQTASAMVAATLEALPPGDFKEAASHPYRDFRAR